MGKNRPTRPALGPSIFLRLSRPAGFMLCSWDMHFNNAMCGLIIGSRFVSRQRYAQRGIVECPGAVPGGRNVESLSARHLGGPHGRGSLNAGRWPSRAARGTGTALAALRETSNAPAHPTWSRTEHQAVSKSRARPGSAPGDLRRWDPRLSLDQLPASSAGRIHADLVADAVQRHVIAAGSRGPRRYDGLRRGSSGASCASRVARGRSEIAVPCISTL